MEDDGIDEYDFEEYRAKWNEMRKTEFNFDQWCKDLDEHPAFMTKLPEDGQLSEAAEAIQAMKYDEEATLEERAVSLKEDGNTHFAKKKYREAIVAYTEGIKLKCTDVEINASLYNNRSACHFRLGNFRSAFKDCLFARKMKPDYEKAFIRGIECLIKLNSPNEALRWIDEASTLLSSTKDALNLRRQVEKIWKDHNREMRKIKMQKTKAMKEKESLLDAFKKRFIKFRNENESGEIDINSLEVSLPQCQSCRVYLNDENILVWPVLFLYPEYNTTDFVQEFEEKSSFHDHMELLFAEKPDWDRKNEYNIDSIEIYFESYTSPDTLISIPLETTLRDVLSNANYRIFKGLPSFLILSKESKFRSNYFTRYSIKNLL